MLKSMLFGGVVETAKPWVATLGGSSPDPGYSVAVAPDGSVYVCGETWSAGAGYSDLLLAKFSSSGTVQWQRILGGSDNDRGRSVAVAPDGSVYVCGYTESAGAGGYDLLLAKFSSSGTVQWQRTLGGSNDDEGHSVAVASDGSVYVCGYTESAGAGNQDLLLAKFSSSGAVQWQKTLGGSDYDDGRSVAVAPDGSVYVCGENRYNFLLAKFSSSGAVQWQKTLGGSNPDSGYSVAVAPDGSVYVCGYIDSYSYFLLAKFSSSGTVQWQRTLGGSDDDEGHSVAVAPDGSVYVCGYTGSAGAGSWDLLLAKITDSLIEKDIVTFGNLNFQDASLTSKNVSLTSKSSSLSVSNAGLTVTTPSLTVVTPSLTTNLYTL
ncbi:SBBP repeat-containing protein [Desulfovibrio sp. SGI.102]|uniref:SBBP repeat-containing protein n=1 Tax=Desulfovibrio sp. SGI.102 TaxID=3420559 RepID=UPI003D00D1A7